MHASGANLKSPILAGWIFGIFREFIGDLIQWAISIKLEYNCHLLSQAYSLTCLWKRIYLGWVPQPVPGVLSRGLYYVRPSAYLFSNKKQSLLIKISTYWYATEMTICCRWIRILLTVNTVRPARHERIQSDVSKGILHYIISEGFAKPCFCQISSLSCIWNPHVW